MLHAEELVVVKSCVGRGEKKAKAPVPVIAGLDSHGLYGGGETNPTLDKIPLLPPLFHLRFSAVDAQACNLSPSRFDLDLQLHQ
jgi:hypothetical protein